MPENIPANKISCFLKSIGSLAKSCLPKLYPKKQMANTGATPAMGAPIPL
ncbi:unnamed protein product [Schistosoma curassoni]|uniref:Uncharacterized protein n=1 Tax=Schistosoma curassoni TaxID=6186 RepID=A0A183K2A3_9TREM|nr:unnamed protein product [Schistosoma curassoni]